MPQIGTFTRTSTGFAGRIRALSFDKEFVIVPAEPTDAEKAPDYRMHLGDADRPEVGAGWTRTGEQANSSPSYSTIRFSSHRSGRDCSAMPTTTRRGRCTGTGCRAAVSGTDPMRTIVLRTAAALLAGIAVGAPILPAGAQTSRPVRAVPVDPYAGHIAEASRRFGIPAAWIRAVMRAESAGDPRAVSHAGAIGLMQVMPATWADLRIRHRLGADPYGPRDNILAGAAYLRDLHDRYGSVPAMLAAYNAGPGRYEASLAGRPLPTETRAYIAAIGPNIDGRNAAERIIVAAADPFAWTRAPLFVASSGRASDVDPVTGGSADATVASAPEEGLFVASAAQVRRP